MSSLATDLAVYAKTSSYALKDFSGFSVMTELLVYNYNVRLFDFEICIFCHFVVSFMHLIFPMSLGQFFTTCVGIWRWRKWSWNLYIPHRSSYIPWRVSRFTLLCSVEVQAYLCISCVCLYKVELIVMLHQHSTYCIIYRVRPKKRTTTKTPIS